MAPNQRRVGRRPGLAPDYSLRLHAQFNGEPQSLRPRLEQEESLLWSFGVRSERSLELLLLFHLDPSANVWQDLFALLIVDCHPVGYFGRFLYRFFTDALAVERLNYNCLSCSP